MINTTMYLFRYLFLLIILLVLSASLCGAKTIEEEKNLNSSVEFGYEKKSGNTEKEAFVFKGKSTYLIDQAEFFLRGDYDYETSKSETIGNKGSVHGGFDYNFSRHNAAFIFQRISFDEFRKIDLKTESGLGWKYTFIRTARTKLSFSSAALYEYERLRNQIPEENIFRASFRIKLDKKIFNGSKISHATFYKPNFKDWSSDYIVTSETALSVPINHIFSIKVAVADEYDSKPQAGVASNDLMLTTTLVINF